MFLHFVTCCKHVMTGQDFCPVCCLFLSAPPSIPLTFLPWRFPVTLCFSVLAAGFINNSWHKSGANNSLVRTAVCHSTAAVLPCYFLLLVPSLQPQFPFIPRSPFFNIPRLLSVKRGTLKISSEDCESMILWRPQFCGLGLKRLNSAFWNYAESHPII